MSNTESEKTSVSFSRYPKDLAEKVLKINFDQFLKRQIFDAKKFVDVRQPPPEIFDKVFAGLVKLLRVHYYPHGLLTEGSIYPYTTAFLTPIIHQVMREEGAVLKIKIEEIDSANLLLENSTGQVDLIIQYLDELNSKQTHLIVVETNGSIDVACLQGMLYMLRAFELNASERRTEQDAKKADHLIYCICTDGVRMNIISYDGTKFEILDKRTVMFAEMGRKEIREETNEAGEKVEKEIYTYKDAWIAQFSEMVSIVYSCLRCAVKKVKE